MLFNRRADTSPPTSRFHTVRRRIVDWCVGRPARAVFASVRVPYFTTSNVDTFIAFYCILFAIKKYYIIMFSCIGFISDSIRCRISCFISDRRNANYMLLYVCTLRK